MADSGKERRRTKRYGIPGSVVRYRKGGILAFLKHPSIKYLILNISEFGMSFITKEELNPGDKISMSISAPKLDMPLSIPGKVIWVKKAKEVDANRVGVEFYRLHGRTKSLMKNLVDNAILNSIDITTRSYFKEIEKL